MELETDEVMVGATSHDSHDMIKLMFVFHVIGESKQAIWPKRPRDALSRKDGDQLQAAMDAELGTILTKKTSADDMRLSNS